MKAPLLLLAVIIFIAFIIVGTNLSLGPRGAYGMPLLSRTVFDAGIGITGGLLLLFLAASIFEILRRRDRIKKWFAERTMDTTFLLPLALFFSAMIFLFFAAALVLSLVQIEEQHTQPPEPPDLVGDVEEVEEETQNTLPTMPPDIPVFEGQETQDSGSRRIVLFALLAVFSAGSIILILRFIRSSRGIPPAEADREFEKLREDLFLASHRSLEKLLEGADPKLAVIAAYAAMEESFAAHNFRKKPAQTPKEFMAHTLSEIRKRSPGKIKSSLPEYTLMQLTDLFEVAKFSTHVIVEKDRESAV